MKVKEKVLEELERIDKSLPDHSRWDEVDEAIDLTEKLTRQECKVELLTMKRSLVKHHREQERQKVLEQPDDKELDEFREWCKTNNIKTWDLRIYPIRHFLNFKLEKLKKEAKE